MATTASPFIWFDNAPKNLNFPGLITDDIKVALCSSSYVPDKATHEFFDVHVTNELPTASGYIAGGQSLASKVISAGDSAGEWKFNSANPTWVATGASLTAHLFVLYNDTPAFNKPLLGYGYLDWNGGTPQDVVTVDTFSLLILVPATGWFSASKTDGT